MDERTVHVEFDVTPGNVETEDDLRELGRFVVEIANDEIQRQDDPEAYHKRLLEEAEVVD